MITPAVTTEASPGAPAAGSASAFISAGVSPEARKRRRYTVAAFSSAFTDTAGWAAAPMAVRALASWLALTNQAPIDAAYVDAAGTSWGRQVALVHPDLAAAFIATAGRIGHVDDARVGAHHAGAAASANAHKGAPSLDIGARGQRRR